MKDKIWDPPATPVGLEIYAIIVKNLARLEKFRDLAYKFLIGCLKKFISWVQKQIGLEKDQGHRLEIERNKFSFHTPSTSIS